MLLVIHNLPKHMRFFDVKCLIQDRCGLEEVILDNFTDEGEHKRVTVGLADEGDAALLVSKIHGLYLDGCELLVEDVRQKKAAEKPYHPVENAHIPKPRSQNQMKYNQSIPLRPEKQTSYGQATPVRPENQSSYGKAAPVRPENQSSYGKARPVRPENQTSYGKATAVRPENQSSYGKARPVRPENQTSYGKAIPVRPENQSSYGTTRPVRPENQTSYGKAIPVRPENQSSYGTTRPVRPENQTSYGKAIPVRPENQSSYGTTRPVRPENQTSYGKARSVRPENQTNFNQSMQTKPMAYSNLPFYMSPLQNLYEGNKNETLQMPKQTLPQPAYFQAHDKPPGVDHQWNIQPGYSSYSEQPRPVSDDNLNERKQWGERQGALSFPKRDHDREDTKSSRYEQGYKRSPDREVDIHGNRTFQSDKSRWIPSVERSDRRDCSPSVRRDGGDRSSRRDDDSMRSQRSSRMERSPPRDRNFEVRRHDRSPNYDDHGRDSGQNDKRRAIDPREGDRDQRRDSTRFEKPLDHDRYNEPRDYKKPNSDKDYGHHNIGKKRPYSEISQSSSRSYGNISNTNTFEKNQSRGIESNRGGFNSNNAPKRVRSKRDKDDTGPGVHSQQIEAPVAKNKPDPPLRTLVNRHNNWRSQFAAMLAKDIIKTARPGGISYYPVMYKKLRECIIARIDVTLGDTLVSSLSELNDAYRSRFLPADDVSFFNAVLQKIERDKAESATDVTKDKAEDKPKIETTTVPIENAGVAGKIGSLLPSLKLPIADSNPRPAAPPFQNRVPLIQNRPTSKPPFQNRAPNPVTLFQNRAPTLLNLFQNTVLNATALFANIPPNPNPYYRNITNQQFLNRASTSTTQFRARAPTSTPQLLIRAPTSTPQNQYRGLLSSPLQRGTVNIPPPKFKHQKKGQKSGKFKRSKKSPTRKQKMKEAKQMHKMEFQEEVVYHLEPLLDQAVEAEMASLIELYTARPEKFMKNLDLKIHKRIIRETTPIFKKLIKLNVTKRILNIFTGLVLRIFPSGKMPNSATFAHHMQQKGVEHIKKCPKMYVVTCNSFKAYDHLLQIGTFKINECQMTVKPMHVTGPRLSLREKRIERQKKAEHSQIMGGDDHGWTDFTRDDDYSDGDDGIDQNFEEMDEAYDMEQTDQDEVELVECEKEVVIIDDNDPIQLGENEYNEWKTMYESKNIWWTPEVEKEMQELRHLFSKAKESKSDVDWSIFKLANCNYKKLLKTTREAYEGKAGSSGTNKKDTESEQTENVVGDVESLDTNSEAAEQIVVSLGKEIEATEKNVDTTEKAVETTEQNVDKSEKEIETTEQNIDTTEKDVETTEQKVVTSEKEIEKMEKNVDSSEKEIETTDQKVVTSEKEIENTEQNVICSERSNEETGATVKEDILKSDISGIADDDLEDF